MKNPSNQFFFKECNNVTNQLKIEWRESVILLHAKVRAFQLACSSESAVIAGDWLTLQRKWFLLQEANWDIPLACVMLARAFGSKMFFCWKSRHGVVQTDWKLLSSVSILKRAQPTVLEPFARLKMILSHWKKSRFPTSGRVCMECFFREDLCVFRFYKLFVFRRFGSLRDSLMDV